MRKIDQKKSSVFNKAAKTISFDKIVLTRLEKLAKEQTTTTSNIVNMLCRRHILTDNGFYRTMAKEHYLEFQKFKYMADECTVMVETK